MKRGMKRAVAFALAAAMVTTTAYTSPANVWAGDTGDTAIEGGGSSDTEVKKNLTCKYKLDDGEMQELYKKEDGDPWVAFADFDTKTITLEVSGLDGIIDESAIEVSVYNLDEDGRPEDEQSTTILESVAGSTTLKVNGAGSVRVDISVDGYNLFWFIVDVPERTIEAEQDLACKYQLDDGEMKDLYKNEVEGQVLWLAYANCDTKTITLEVSKLVEDDDSGIENLKVMIHNLDGDGRPEDEESNTILEVSDDDPMTLTVKNSGSVKVTISADNCNDFWFVVDIAEGTVKTISYKTGVGGDFIPVSYDEQTQKWADIKINTKDVITWKFSYEGYNVGPNYEWIPVAGQDASIVTIEGSKITANKAGTVILECKDGEKVLATVTLVIKDTDTTPEPPTTPGDNIPGGTTPGGTTTPEDTTKPGDTTIPGDTTQPSVPEKGEEVTVSNGATYVVTKPADETKAPTVKFTAPAKSAATVKIPSTVKVDGVTYKVTAIAANAFKGDKKVTTVVVGSNVTTIGAGAFANCTKLTKVTVSSEVTKIGANAFKGDENLKTIVIKSTKLTSTSITKNAFKGISAKAVIKVPASKLKAYKKYIKASGCNAKVKAY